MYTHKHTHKCKYTCTQHRGTVCLRIKSTDKKLFTLLVRVQASTMLLHNSARHGFITITISVGENISSAINFLSEYNGNRKNHGRHYVVKSDVFVKSNEVRAAAGTLVSSCGEDSKIINHCAVVFRSPRTFLRSFFLKLN